MMATSPYLRMSFPYGGADEDGVVKVRVETARGSFAGSAEGCIGIKGLEEFVERLRELPHKSPDSVKFSADVPGAILVELHTVSRTGRMVALMAVVEPSDLSRKANMCEIWMSFEVPALERFRAQLARLLEMKTGEAELSGFFPCP